MRRSHAAAVLLAAVVILARGRASAQALDATDSSARAVHGSVDVGYRFSTITGSDQTYRQLFNLSEGLRLMDFQLRSDLFALSASGIGGDPFPTVQLTSRKAGRYDLRVNWRQSRRYDFWPATPTSIAGFDTQAVTDHHGWTSTRQIGNVALSVDATARLHLLFNADRVSRDGSLDTTRSLDFVGAPPAWGAFARANPYALRTPIDDGAPYALRTPINETANRMTGGLSYSGRRWTAHYEAGYQTFEENSALGPPSAPERSINVADPATAKELLAALGWSETRHLSSPLSELSYVVQLSPKIEWRGEYFFYRYEGPFSLTASYRGTARTNSAGTSFSPYDVAATASGDVSGPSNVVGQDVTFRLDQRWRFDVRYRYSHLASEAQGEIRSLLSLYPPAQLAPVSSSEVDETTWRQTQHAVNITATFEPSPVLTIRPGAMFSQRHVQERFNGVLDPARSKQEQTVWPELTVGYRPQPWLSARGSFRSSYSDASYTRMSPTQRTVALAMLRIEPLSGLTLDASMSRTNAELLTAEFTSLTSFGGIQASYALDDRLSVVGGLDYQSFLGHGSVSFNRGTPPIAENQMIDREIDRIWQLGVTVKATRRLGVTATANFLRTTGTDSIAGEPPLYGPVTFPYGTASVSYDVPRVGKVAVDLQRTYMYQELLPMNDFRATLLTLRYSRSF
jgi:hypothetical protein